jgi:hypothetical protein
MIYTYSVWAHYTDCRRGGEFWKIEVVRWCPNNALMSWLRLYTTPLCISYSYNIYNKCFSILILACGWEAYGCTLMVIHQCRRGVFIENWGTVEPEWCFNVVVEAVHHPTLHLTSILHVYDMFWYIDMLWVGKWVHPTDTPVQGGGI